MIRLDPIIITTHGGIPIIAGANYTVCNQLQKQSLQSLLALLLPDKEFPDLSTTVLSFFDTTQVKNIDDRKRKLNIRHLLTMTAGFDWDEGFHYSDPRNDCSRMEASFDWIQYVIDKPMALEPGQSFKYNSGAFAIALLYFQKSNGKGY